MLLNKRMSIDYNCSYVPLREMEWYEIQVWLYDEQCRNEKADFNNMVEKSKWQMQR